MQFDVFWYLHKKKMKNINFHKFSIFLLLINSGSSIGTSGPSVSRESIELSKESIGFLFCSLFINSFLMLSKGFATCFDEDAFEPKDISM